VDAVAFGVRWPARAKLRWLIIYSRVAAKLWSFVGRCHFWRRAPHRFTTPPQNRSPAVTWLHGRDPARFSAGKACTKILRKDWENFAGVIESNHHGLQKRPLSAANMPEKQSLKPAQQRGGVCRTRGTRPPHCLFTLAEASTSNSS
jgi:hypothetical protein